MLDYTPITGNHIFMSPEEIEKWWTTLETEHATSLSKYSVELPKKGSGKALWLVFLRKNMGKPVHKDVISSFVNSVNHESGKDQQVRHLAADGWYVLNKGDEIPNEDGTLKSGFHMLVTTKSPKPTFIFKSLKRANRLIASDFEQLKAVYDFRCATCGSQEDKPHFIEPDKRTELHQGHMNPHKALTLENSIPQCQVCNGVYQDDFIFNDKGRIIAVASVNPVIKAERDIREKIKKILDKEFPSIMP